MNQRFDRLVGRAMQVLSLTVIGVFVALLLMVRVPSLRATVFERSRQYTRGDQFDIAPAVFDRSPYTLLVFGRSSCQACVEGASQLSTIVALTRKIGSIRAVLAVVSPNGVDLTTEIEYATKIGIGPANVVRLTTVPRKLRVVPSLVVVDRRGTVMHFQEGVRDVSEIQQMFQKLTAVNRS